ncbi:exopolysaccharide biosynthesis protein [Caballeronia arationis]|jgi:tyrosine-protein kinase Etk/Wzc|uniref:Tyrosine-protein kinase Etk/Wzc n=1 Tax=Caballeronia arationis TaxID=1777142 RepID=A0A7Z7N6H9_9BURK|nr:polysaccharide biosynthesis tyrosine autokinase [Caballeronia arationis]SAK63530.1 exopolysaccharide biosynthesis protein [Caballeronia arationis]SOE88751.1 tyrosine-protein kinase Etk/Wzc [Caballeronia arationis]
MNRPALDYVPARSGPTVTSTTASLYQAAVDNIWGVVLIVLAVTCVAIGYAFLSVPSYTADSVVRVEYPTSNALGLDARSGRGSQEVVPKTLPSDAEMQIILSRTVLWPVIQKYKQDILVTPDQVPVIGRISELIAASRSSDEPMPAFLGLRSYAWGGEKIDVQTLQVPSRYINQELTLRALADQRYEVIDKNGNTLIEGAAGSLAQKDGVSILVSQLVARPGTEFMVERLSEYSALQRFGKQVKASEPQKESGVVQISYENKDPKLAQDVTNAIAQTYIASHVDQRRTEAGSTREFIQSELPRLKEELKRTESNLSEYRTDADSMTPSSEADSYLKSTLDIDKQIAALDMQRTQVASRFGPGTRDIQTIDEQLGLLKQQKAQLESRFSQLPESDRRAADLTREAKVAESIYVAMQGKSNELDVTRAGTLGNVHLVDSALFPSEASKPKRLVVIASGLVAGLLLGMLFVIYRKLTSRSIVLSPDAAEYHLQLPVFGTVGFSAEQARLEDSPIRTARMLSQRAGVPPSDKTALVLSADTQNEGAIEALRAIHASLMRDIERTGSNVLAIVGAAPGTGKTFVASNLAVIHAHAGNRVLLIDGDLRRGKVATEFGLPNDIGLADVLAEKQEIDRVIQPCAVPGLSVISSGLPPANPSKLLSTTRLRLLLERLAPHYDLIVIDTPAVLAASDAVMIAATAGSAAIVVRPGVQTEDELGETTRRLDLAGARVAGAIFNAMPKRRSEKRMHPYPSHYSDPSRRGHSPA